MDFEKIRTAAEEIKLSDAEKEKMILLCEESKKTKKKFRFAPVAAAAAVAVFAFIIFSPGFLLKASEADKNFAPQEEAAVNDYECFADSANGADSIILNSSAAVNYRRIYYEVPKEFRNLVSEEKYAEWEQNLKNDNCMAVVKFIEEFNISKESFEKANAAYARRVYSDFGLEPLLLAADCEEQEEAEIFNADIIYTFDKDRIDSYYLRPDYEFDSLSALDAAIENGYVSVSEKVSEEYYLQK